MDQNSGPLESSNVNIVLDGHEVAKMDIAGPLSPDELVAKINESGDALRALIVLAKKLPRQKELGPHQDPIRSIALAQSHLQTGYMWLRRAVEQPKVF